MTQDELTNKLCNEAYSLAHQIRQIKAWNGGPVGRGLAGQKVREARALKNTLQKLLVANKIAVKQQELRRLRR